MPPTATSPTAKHCSERLQRLSNFGWRRGCGPPCADGARVSCCGPSALATSSSRWTSQGGSRSRSSEPANRAKQRVPHHIWPWLRRSTPWWMRVRCHPNDVPAPSGPVGRRCTASPNWPCMDHCEARVAGRWSRWRGARSTTSLPVCHADGSSARRLAGCVERVAGAHGPASSTHKILKGTLEED